MINPDAIRYLEKHGLKYSEDVVKMSENALVDAGDGSAFHVNELKKAIELELRELVVKHGNI